MKEKFSVFKPQISRKILPTSITQLHHRISQAMGVITTHKSEYTPLLENDRLSAIAGARVLVKMESL